MAINEHSIGRLYVAQMRLEGKTAKRQWTTGIIQECEPWRRGKAKAFTIFKRRALLVGWWKKTQRSFETEREAELFEDVQWLDPQLMFTQPDEIAEWDDGREDSPTQDADTKLT